MSWQPYTDVELEDHSNPKYLEAFGNYAYNAVLQGRAYAPNTHDYEIFNEYNTTTYNVLNEDGTSTGQTKKGNS